MEKIIKIKSKIENLKAVEKFIDEITFEYKLNEEAYGNILIATLEASNNAIVHGNKLNENLDVVIEFKLDNEKILITVADKGKGFDYNNIPDPTSPDNIEKINGRGVFLMQKLSDQINFIGCGNKVELKFNL